MIRLFHNRPLVKPQEGCVWRDISYQLKVSHQRKTIGFKVTADAISITVPYGISAPLLEQALVAKYAWIKAKHLQSQQWTKPQEKQINLSFEDHSLWLVWGVERAISWHIDNTYWYCLSESSLRLSIQSRKNNLNCRMDYLRHWYHLQAEQFICQRIRYWCPIMGITLKRVTQITVRKYSARWGSCSVDGHLKFNRLLAMVPTEVFDYVIVHELCHLQHMHHRSAFWQLVKSHCPQYKFHQQWLKNHGRGLLALQVLK